MANKVEVDIELRLNQAEKNLKSLTSQIEKFGQKSKESGGIASTALATMGGIVGGVGVIGAFNKLTSVVGDGITGLRSFETAVREVNTILPKNQKVTAELQQTFKRLSNEYATSPTEQVKAFYNIVSSGTTDATEATYLLSEANKLAVGGLAEMSSTISVLTQIKNVYGDVDGAADSLFKTVQLGVTTVPELASNLGKVLPLAQQAGISLDEVGASIANLTSQGLTTSERVTQFNSFLVALSRNAAKLGEGFDITALKTKGLSKFLADLEKKTKGSSTKLFELLGANEAVQFVIGNTGKNLEKLNGNLAEFESKAGVASRAVGELKEGLDFRLKEITNRWENLKIELAERFTPTLEALIPLAERLLGSLTVPDYTKNSIRELNDEYNELKKTLESASDPVIKAQAEAKIEGVKKELGNRNSKGQDGSLLLRPSDTSAPGLNTSLPGSQGAEVPLAPGQSSSGIDFEKLNAEENQKTEILLAKEEERKEAVAEKEAVTREVLKANADAFRIEQEELQLERKIASGEIDEQERQESIAKLEALERKKLDIKTKAELDRTKLIKDAKTRQLKEEEIAAKKSVELEKLKTEAKKREAANQELIEKTKLATANNFLQAGITLAKEGSNAQKALQITQATIAGFTAINSALANPPGPPFSIGLAASIGAVTAANVAKIAGAKFNQGGIVGGTPPANPNSDNVIAQVRSGELILNEAQQNVIAGKLSGGGVTVNVQGNVIADNDEQVANLIERIRNAITYDNVEGF